MSTVSRARSVTAGCAVALAVLLTATVLTTAAAPASASTSTPTFTTASLATAALGNAGSFIALPPTRLLDTRIGLDAQPVAPMSVLHLQVEGAGGVPSAGVAAVVLNVTVTASTQPGFLTAYADATTQPATSNLVFGTGQTVSTVVIAAPGANGRVALFNSSLGTTHLTADVSGYYTGGISTMGGGFTAVPPTRLLDTRLSGGPVGAQLAVALPVLGRAGVPAAGVSALALTVTVVDPAQAGAITAYAAGAARPSAWNLNFGAGQVVANLAVVGVGADGTVQLFNDSLGSVQLAVDVAGFYNAGPARAVGSFTPLTPARLLDTRSGLNAVAAVASTEVSFPVTGRAGVPTGGVAAVVLNVTAVAPTLSGSVDVYALGASRPAVPALNFVAGQVVANLALAPIGADGRVALYNDSAGPTDFVVDVLGYVAGVPTTPAAAAVPRASTSRYVRDLTGAPGDVDLMHAHGCGDATANGEVGDFVSVLDIGAQTVHAPLALSSPGVVLSTTDTRLSYRQLVAAINGYVQGYASCRTGSASATIAIATNSDGEFSSYPASAKAFDWAGQVVIPVAAAAAATAPGITIAAGIDIEAGFAASELDAEQWIQGFVGASAATIFQIGSADGCPTTIGVTGQSCAAITDDNGVRKTWTQAQYYALSHGLSSRLVALPEIYLPEQAIQWANIARTGATATDKIRFVGALTERAACGATATDKIRFVGALTERAACGATCSLAPAEGFAALRDALDTTALTAPDAMIYSTDLRIDD
jgi:hypothetical protein